MVVTLDKYWAKKGSWIVDSSCHSTQYNIADDKKDRSTNEAKCTDVCKETSFPYFGDASKVISSPQQTWSYSPILAFSIIAVLLFFKD